MKFDIKKLKFSDIFRFPDSNRCIMQLLSYKSGSWIHWYYHKFYVIKSAITMKKLIGHNKALLFLMNFKCLAVLIRFVSYKGLIYWYKVSPIPTSREKNICECRYWKLSLVGIEMAGLWNFINFCKHQK